MPFLFYFFLKLFQAWQLKTLSVWHASISVRFVVLSASLFSGTARCLGSCIFSSLVTELVTSPRCSVSFDWIVIFKQEVRINCLFEISYFLMLTFIVEKFPLRTAFAASWSLVCCISIIICLYICFFWFFFFDPLVAAFNLHIFVNLPVFFV